MTSGRQGSNLFGHSMSNKKSDHNNVKNERKGQPVPSKSNRMSYNNNSRAMSSSAA